MFQFDYLLKGNYQVRFTPKDSKYKGYAVTKKAIGTTDRNSDINTGYITDNIELIDAQLLAEGSYSQRVVNIDAGIYSNAHRELPQTGFNYNFYIPVLILNVVTLILFNDKRRIFKEIW